MCRVWRDDDDGVFSAWNGQSPFYAEPARLSATVSPTMLGHRELRLDLGDDA